MTSAHNKLQSFHAVIMGPTTRYRSFLAVRGFRSFEPTAEKERYRRNGNRCEDHWNPHEDRQNNEIEQNNACSDIRDLI